MAVLVIASTSTTCDTSQLQKSIDTLTDKINMLVNLTLTLVNPIPATKNVPKDICSCKNNAQAIENNTQDIEELYSKNEEFEDQIEQLKLTMKFLFRAFNNFTRPEPPPTPPPDNCNDVVFPPPRSCQEIKDKCPRSPSGNYTLVSGKVYCHMEDLCNTSGGWTRIAYLNMSDLHEQCPPGFKLYNQNGVRACGRFL